MTLESRVRWWGGRRHKIFTVAVFVILASLDNAARGVFPPLYAVMARSLAVSEAALGLVTAISILVVALTAVFWGYWGDRGSRKALLFYGTLLWSGAMFLTALARTYNQLLLFQLITAAGIGCIAAVGFSVVTDLVPAPRRGLMMSLWGLSQGGGGGGGSMLGSMFGAYNWRVPFLAIAGAGFVFALLFLFSYEPQRGRAEPELDGVFAAGDRYAYRIKRADLRRILANRTNVWLIWQGLMSTITFGSLIWMPRLFIARVEAAGYDLETATIAGNLLSLIFQAGFYFAVLAGHVGDRWQRRDRRGRALICTAGVLGAIPFQIVLFFVPLTGLALPDGAGLAPVVWATLASLVSNGWVALAFLLALFAWALASADGPNRAALIAEVNLPEHRGTVAGLNTLVIGLGLALGNVLTGATSTFLTLHLALPLNYALGLALFQLFFLPAGLFYYRTTKTAPADMDIVHRTLARRARRQ